MNRDFNQMARAEISIDAQEAIGPFEAWRHTFGQGGISRQPLGEKVIRGAKKLRPKLIRIFLSALQPGR